MESDTVSTKDPRTRVTNSFETASYFLCTN